MKKVVYSPKYKVDIGNHVFPTVKYDMVKDLLGNDVEFIEPGKALDEDILLVHTRDYLDKIKNGTLRPEEEQKLELPYSKALALASIICCGGSIKAAEIALEDGVGAHLGGGFHHAFPDHGEGFCVFNDVAVAVRKLLKSKKIKKAMVIDCDLHQGNGTASIFAQDKAVFTFSIHQQNNYPFIKPASDLDIGLADGTEDDEYLAQLEKNIPIIVDKFKPEFIMYVAGADPYRNDMIGGLRLTIEGLRKRDEFVAQQAKTRQIPIAVVLAGGYAIKVEDTAKIQYNTVKTLIS